MSNDEYRAEQAERRQHGLKARHELRLENATYTAAEVKVLTETATKFGYELGRKEAIERAEAILRAHWPYMDGGEAALQDALDDVRDLTLRPTGAT